MNHLWRYKIHIPPDYKCVYTLFQLSPSELSSLTQKAQIDLKRLQSWKDNNTPGTRLTPNFAHVNYNPFSKQQAVSDASLSNQYYKSLHNQPHLLNLTINTHSTNKPYTDHTQTGDNTPHTYNIRDTSITLPIHHKSRYNYYPPVYECIAEYYTSKFNGDCVYSHLKSETQESLEWRMPSNHTNINTYDQWEEMYENIIIDKLLDEEFSTNSDHIHTHFLTRDDMYSLKFLEEPNFWDAIKSRVCVCLEGFNDDELSCLLHTLNEVGKLSEQFINKLLNLLLLNKQTQPTQLIPILHIAYKNNYTIHTHSEAFNILQSIKETLHETTHTLSTLLQTGEILNALGCVDEPLWCVWLESIENLSQHLHTSQIIKVLDIFYSRLIPMDENMSKLANELNSQLHTHEMKYLSSTEISNLLLFSVKLKLNIYNYLPNLVNTIVERRVNFSNFKDFLRASTTLHLYKQFSNPKLAHHFISQCVKHIKEFTNYPSHLLFLLQGFSQCPLSELMAVEIEPPSTHFMTDYSGRAIRTQTHDRFKDYTHEFARAENFSFSTWQPTSIQSALKGLFQRVISLLHTLTDSQLVQATQAFSMIPISHTHTNIEILFEEIKKRVTSFTKSEVSPLLSSLSTLDQYIHKSKRCKYTTDILTEFAHRFINEDELDNHDKYDDGLQIALQNSNLDILANTLTTDRPTTLYPNDLNYTRNVDCMGEIFLIFDQFHIYNPAVADKFFTILSRNDFSLLKNTPYKASSLVNIVHFFAHISSIYSSLNLCVLKCVINHLELLNTVELLNLMDAICQLKISGQLDDTSSYDYKPIVKNIVEMLSNGPHTLDEDDRNFISQSLHTLETQF